jgi:hypothetical protein
LPAADTHDPRAIQEKASLAFLAKFVRTVAMLRSPHAGERANAKTLATRMFNEPDVHWEVLTAALDAFSTKHEAERKLATVLEVAEILQARNNELTAENENLRASANSNAFVTWTDVNTHPSEVNRVAHWALDLHNRKRVRLTTWEVGFVLDCTTWSRPLSQKMRPKFEQIVNLIIRHTGELPPTT